VDAEFLTEVVDAGVGFFAMQPSDLNTMALQP